MTAIDGDPLRSDTKKRLPLLQRQSKKGVRMIYHQLQKIESPYSGRAIVDNRLRLVDIQPWCR